MSTLDSQQSAATYQGPAKPATNFDMLSSSKLTARLATLRTGLQWLVSHRVAHRLLPTLYSTKGFAGQQEVMVNVMMGGLVTVTVIRLGMSLTVAEPVSMDQVVNSSLSHLVFLVLLLGIWQLCRLGYRQLAQQQDHLEVVIAERTRELWDTRGSRDEALQRYAEFGRLSAGLLHEVSIPLTAATLNLDQFDDHGLEMVLRARKNLRQLERYIDAARQQLLAQTELTTFTVKTELDKLALVMLPLAQRAGVALIITSNATAKLHGDAVKFNQVVANLIANSIDAYVDATGTLLTRRIVVTVTKKHSYLELSVQDWGKGITREELQRVFEPFFTTKTTGDRRGLGIGLSMVKQIVMVDFHGSLHVTSSTEHGTRFTAHFKAVS